MASESRRICEGRLCRPNLAVGGRDHCGSQKCMPRLLISQAEAVVLYLHLQHLPSNRPQRTELPGEPKRDLKVRILDTDGSMKNQTKMLQRYAPVEVWLRTFNPLVDSGPGLGPVRSYGKLSARVRGVRKGTTAENGREV